MPHFVMNSLFCGCGGIDLGFTGGFTFLGEYYPQTGITLGLANDFNSWACRTFRKNFGAKIIEGDICKIPSSSFPPADIITGGFPCQDFSVTRAKTRGGIEVKRGQLYLEFVRLVHDLRPKVFVAENVKGLLSANNGLAIQTITSDFESLGYIVSKDVWNFSHYKVPQARERLIIVGIREDVNFLYKKPLPKSLHKPVTVLEAFKDIKAVSENNEPIPIRERTSMIIAAIPEGGNIHQIRDKNLAVKALMANIYKRVDRNKPSPTILAGGGGGSWGYHFEEPRPLTNRERARIQSFPDSFIFEGNHTEVRRQIGNAVPPVGAYYIAQAVLPALTAPMRTPDEIRAVKEFRNAEQLKLDL